MSLYAIGTKVRLKHTGDEGVISELLAGDMATVELPDGDEIPVFLEDIISIEDERRALSSKPPVKAKIVKGKNPPQKQAPAWPEPDQQYTILKSLGIQLCFESHLRPDGIPDTYSIYLVNDTASNVLFSCQLLRRNLKSSPAHGVLKSVSAIKIGTMSYDDLSEGYAVQIECWKVTTEGNGPRLEKQIKLKPKQFFKNKRTAPILNREVHHYVAFANLTPPAVRKSEDLKSYTDRHIEQNDNWQPLQDFYQNEVTQFADYPREIDLHIEHLTSSVKGRSNAEMLTIQMDAFYDYLDRAIELGVSPVFIIHGVGKGRLKQHIADALKNYTEVKKFKNEFHEKYGWGATEVQLY